MKLKILKKYKNKTVQLNLLKFKLYKKKQSYNLDFNSKKIELNFKKMLHVIYKYHINKKKILFLEFPKSLKHTLKNTKHILIPNHILHTDILNYKTVNLNNSNTTSQNKKIPLNIVKVLLKLNKKVDLIVIYNSSDVYNSIIKKSYKSKTPIISCFNEFNKLNNKITYKTVTDSKSLNEKRLNNNFIFTMVKTTLKKAIAIQKRIIPILSNSNLKKPKTRHKSKYNYASFKK